MRSFELTFRPNTALVSVVRRFVSDFYDRLLDDSDATSRVALATHELLENAVKYASDGETRLRVEFDPAAASLTVRTWNRTSAEHLDALRQAFADMEGAGDPLAFYQAAMRKTSKQAEGSGLGLARVLAEAEMSMHLEVEADQVLIVGCTSLAEAACTSG